MNHSHTSRISLPPVVWVFVFALIEVWLAYGTSLQIASTATMQMILWIIAMLLALTSAVVIYVALRLFWRSKASVNPNTLTASTLVTNGIYRHTRNPMYLGFLLLLIALAIYINNPLSLSIALLFIPLMNHNQIKHEEAFLAEHFGDRYQSYCARSPRWFWML